MICHAFKILQTTADDGGEKHPVTDSGTHNSTDFEDVKTTHAMADACGHDKHARHSGNVRAGKSGCAHVFTYHRWCSKPRPTASVE